MKGGQIHRKIVAKLTYYQDYVKNLNEGASSYDINRDLEIFYKPIFDIIYATDFQILENSKINYPAIDLGCTQMKIGIQITTNTCNAKISETLEKFHATKHRKLLEGLDTIVIFFAGKNFHDSRSKNSLIKWLNKENEKYETSYNYRPVRISNIHDIPSLLKLIKLKHILNNNELNAILYHLDDQIDNFVNKNRYYDSDDLNNLESLNEKAQDQSSTIDALKFVVKSFEDIYAWPEHLLYNAYPIKTKGKLRPDISRFSLYTNNKEFYDDVKFVIENKSKEIKSFDFLAKFFNQNLIQHLHHGNERICVHGLKGSSYQCLCSKCRFQRYDYVGSFNQIKHEYSGGVEDLFKSAYTNYKFGNFDSAYEGFVKAAELFKSDHSNIRYFITILNLHSINRLSRKNRDKFVEDTDLVRLKLKQNKISSEVADLLEWMENKTFLSSCISKLAVELFESQRIHRKDAYGVIDRTSRSVNVKNIIARCHVFMNENNIIYDIYKDFSDIVHLACDALFGYFRRIYPNGKATTQLDEYFIFLLLEYCDKKHLNEYVQKYKIYRLEYTKSHEKHSSLIQNIDNLCQSASFLSDFNKDGIEERFFFIQKCNTIIENYFWLINLLVISRSDFNSSIYNLWNSFYGHSRFRRSLFDGIETLLLNRPELFQAKTLNSIVKKTRTDDDAIKSGMLTVLMRAYDFNSYKMNRSLQLLAKRLVREWLQNEKSSLLNIDDAFDLIEYFDEMEKSYIASQIKSKLADNFDFNLYFVSAGYNILEMDMNLVNKMVKVLANHWEPEDYFHNPSGPKVKNLYLNRFIELCFKFDINLSVYSKKDIHHDVEYYKWLMNIDSYDYNKFDVHWLAQYRFYPSTYKDKWRDNMKIKNAISAFVKVNKGTYLTDMYFTLYGE